jgi:hypothetical protein
MDLRPTPKEWSGGIFHGRSQALHEISERISQVTIYSWISIIEKRMDLRPTPKEWSGGIFNRRSLHFNITIPNVLLMLCDQLSPRVRNFPKCALSYAIYLSIRLPKFPSFSPKMFPIAPQFYPIWFAQSPTLMYINWKGTLNSGTFVSILHLGSRELLLLRSAQCSKKFGHGPINVAPSPKKIF